jgi:nucleotide-binding universal stress UspA family protein
MKRILCATDGSAHAQKAVDFSINLARQAKAELTFIHVVVPDAGDVSRTYFWDSSRLQTTSEPLQTELYQAMQQAMQQQLESVFCTTVPGINIAKAIIDYAEKNDHDHVVTGSVGRTGVAKVLLGSIAEQVISKAHCPVTVVR